VNRLTDLDDFQLGEPLERDLRAAFAAPVPALHFNPTPARRAAILARRSVRLGLGVSLLTAALVVGIVSLPLFGVGGTPTVNAQDLVVRSTRTSASMTSVAPAYHMVSVVELGKAGAGRTETWFDGTASSRTESTSTEAGVDSTFGMAFAGDELWLYQTRAGQTVVAHLAHSGRNDGLAASQGLWPLASSADYTIPGCQSASITGDTTVAGRSAYVVEVRPTPATCVADPAHPDTLKVAGHAADLGTATFAIDKATDLTLSLVQRDRAGGVTYSFQVQSFETGPAAAGAGLPYLPPTGARLVEVADYSSAKSVFEPAGSQTVPPTK
jgi:hypothetical protein